MGATTWPVETPGQRYGLSAGSAASHATTETATITAPSLAAQAESKLWHPDSPMFWLLAFGAVTFGLMAASTSVRVGPAKVSAALGKP